MGANAYRIRFAANEEKTTIEFVRHPSIFFLIILVEGGLDTYVHNNIVNLFFWFTKFNRMRCIFFKKSNASQLASI